jgi:hypothetical protein
VQAEAVDVGAQRLLEVLLPGYDALQRQHLLSGARAEGDAISAGCRLQWPEHAGFVRIAVVVGHVSRTLRILFGYCLLITVMKRIYIHRFGWQ